MLASGIPPGNQIMPSGVSEAPAALGPGAVPLELLGRLPLLLHLPPVEKYFGKWPFQRVAGMQEVVSVAASLANLAAHLWCIARFWAFLRRPGGISSTSRPLQLSASSLHHQQQYRQHVGSGGPAAGTGEVALHLQLPGSPGGAHTTTTRAGASSPGADAHHRGAASEPARYPFRFLWTAYALLHSNAWIWSALFHCRDTRLTERLDYCSAVGLVAFGLGAAAWRVLWGRGRGRRIGAAATCAAVAVGFVRHMRYMLYVKFDYGYNMKACVAAGVLTAMLWVAWVTLVRHPGRRRMYLFICMVHAAMLLELFDFPPLVRHLVDAHAAWHVATVPLTPLFYAWLQSDAAMVLGAAEEQGKRKAT
ncbi:hypothetical protein HYH03_012588 [Edaphochlamys debaryana]|uniref:Post-GPI attachment to proteins factor 3 n=1 Tax=Edaphochlamys debaryana TaxID=47281 RepID=A0A835XPZ9_9CHLO|nr:hypothetical protein HYH03_012588 [Edaphochlamys debaryana]|eukprot:KAG2488972.1 hypothetical protein HYH03_012588 [Edaphochlamys debaryana]